MKYFRQIFPISFILLAVLAAVAAGNPPLPAGLIPIQSVEGTRLLEESGARANFYALIQQLTSQQNLSYCGVASAVTVLNTIRPTNTPPCESLEGKVHFFDQVNFFSQPVEQVVAQSVVARQGFTLEEWTGAMRTWGVKAEAWHCGTREGQADYDAFLEHAKAALKSTNQFLVVNFSRKTLAQAGKGHFSPISAYNEKANKFLVLDVAQFKYPVFWVDANLLWQSMNTVDSVSKTNRGFVIVTTE